MKDTINNDKKITFMTGVNIIQDDNNEEEDYYSKQELYDMYDEQQKKESEPQLMLPGPYDKECDLDYYNHLLYDVDKETKKFNDNFDDLAELKIMLGKTRKRLNKHGVSVNDLRDRISGLGNIMNVDN